MASRGHMHCAEIHRTGRWHISNKLSRLSGPHLVQRERRRLHHAQAPHLHFSSIRRSQERYVLWLWLLYSRPHPASTPHMRQCHPYQPPSRITITPASRPAPRLLQSHRCCSLSRSALRLHPVNPPARWDSPPNSQCAISQQLITATDATLTLSDI